MRQMNAPPLFPTVDPDRDLRVGRRIVGGIVQDNEAGPKVADGMDVTVDAELHANNR